jgi:lipopolysaccharide transport system permease protein
LLALGIQLWFYASPIIYPVSMVPEQLRPIYNLNPMTGILEAYRAVLIYQSFPPPSFYLSAVIAFLMLLIGYIYFKRAEFQFADVV